MSDREDFMRWMEEHWWIASSDREKSACLSAFLAGRKPPEGWKLVPVEPTPEMVGAIGQREIDLALEGFDRGMTAVYKAMLNAAPERE